LDKAWVRLEKETKRRFANATWVPLRASIDSGAGDDVTKVGFSSEVFAAGSVAIPPANRELGDKLSWGDIGIGHSVLPYAYEDGHYSPIEERQYNDKQPIGVELIFEHPQPVVGGRKWIINPDLIVALGLIQERDNWVRPEEDFVVVIREKKRMNGDHELIEIKTEFLLDYLAARGMSLRMSYYYQRVENVGALEGTDYAGLAKEDGPRDDGRFSLLIRKSDDVWGGTWSMFRAWRTDVDEDSDAPVMGPENAENVDYETSSGKRSGYQGYRVEGEFWRDEWIDHKGKSHRVRGDEVEGLPDFIVGVDGSRSPSKELNDEDVGKWLWFRPSVVVDFLGRRGFSLEWYTAETAGLHSTSGYRIHLGLNDSDLVSVYARDIARLPEWEQRIWAAHNAAPEGGVSKELTAAQVRSAPASTSAPEKYLLEILVAFEDAFRDKYGADLFSHPIDGEVGAKINRFLGRDQASVLRIAKELVRAFSDRLNIQILRQISTHPEKKKLGSNKLLESIVAGNIGKDEARKLFGVVAGVYDLRTGDAHPTSSGIADAFSLAEVDVSQTHLRQAQQMVDNFARAIWSIGSALFEK
jgi:hypothetical protein